MPGKFSTACSELLGHYSFYPLISSMAVIHFRTCHPSVDGREDVPLTRRELVTQSSKNDTQSPRFVTQPSRLGKFHHLLADIKKSTPYRKESQPLFPNFSFNIFQNSSFLSNSGRHFRTCVLRIFRIR